MVRRALAVASMLGVAIAVGCNEQKKPMPATKPVVPATRKAGPEFTDAYPNMLVADVAKAVEFYKSKLGFDEAMRGPNFAVVKRDAVTLGLIQSKDAGKGWCYLTVSDPKGAYEEYVRAGVKVVAPLKDWGGGHVEFTITDPEGNKMDVGN